MIIKISLIDLKKNLEKRLHRKYEYTTQFYFLDFTQVRIKKYTKKVFQYTNILFSKACRNFLSNFYNIVTEMLIL